ncbi:hypothetical protein, partial [Roseibacillus persicicus]|uniref:hypothetical protein n=1 Tax=Roseibacillus persicicus TaxID=454148 RepID=UPI00280C8BA6
LQPSAQAPDARLRDPVVALPTHDSKGSVTPPGAATVVGEAPFRAFRYAPVPLHSTSPTTEQNKNNRPLTSIN